MRDAPEKKMRRSKPDTERGVGGDHAGCGKMPVEAGRESPRHDVVIDDVSGCGRRRRQRGDGARRLAMRARLEETRPPQRARVMDRVTQRGVAKVGAMAMHRGFAPRPMTGRVDAAGGASGADARIERHRNG